MDEQAVDTESANELTGQTEPVRTIDTVIDEALGEKQATPDQAGAETGEVQKEGQPKEALFGELVIGAQKIPFSKEEDFNKFLESNPLLKDKVLMRKDYSQKTTALAEERKELEERIREIEESEKVWGEEKPPNEWRMGLADLWNVYRTQTDPSIRKSIEDFVNDAILLSQGLEPTSFLALPKAATTTDPFVSELKKEIAGLRNEVRGFQKMTQAEKQAEIERQQAEKSEKIYQDTVAWRGAKEKDLKGPIPEDELKVMRQLMSALDEDGTPYFTLDQAYKLARAELGRLEADTAKKVIQDAKKQNQKSGVPPQSRASSSEEPEPKTLDELIDQGFRKLGG